MSLERLPVSTVSIKLEDVQASTLVDIAQVQRITAFTNGLPMAPFLPDSCPEFSPGVLQLTFTARSGGPALAVLTAELTGCYTDF